MSKRAEPMADVAGTGDLLRTPLYDFHVANGARMVAFASYEMPVQYPLGILKEHLHTRSSAGLFDISHMGQLSITAPGGHLDEAKRALEAVIPIDILGLPEGRQRYGFFTNDTGGILDDLMIANLGDRLVLIVNAARKSADEAHLRQHLPGGIGIERIDSALIALQGPKAAGALARLAPECESMRFMDVKTLKILGHDCLASRSGYTGEDGFEISVPEEAAEAIARTLLGLAEVEAIGLGARDSLRLEAGLCLHGSDIDETTTPVEARLTWAIPKVRRAGGARAAGFPGADIIMRQLHEGVSRLRVGLRPEGRAPVRGGVQVYAREAGGEVIGHATSGGFGPSVGSPVAMGYVETSLSEPGTRLFAELRGKRLALDVAQLPFVPSGYKR
ncbi:MAG: glycine cleavage system protein T [Alphaproteobacteria bacterium BRH_c36]|nr:MAG: glycine cleavage system protein T [Alphaproteobacteria bacterium BRH_c36]